MSFLALPEEEDVASASTLPEPVAAWRDSTAAIAPDAPTPPGAALAEPPLGTKADPRTFLRDDDFPHWIRELPALPPRPDLPATAFAPPSMEPALLVASPENLPPPGIPATDAAAVSQGTAEQALHATPGGAALTQAPASSPGAPAGSTAPPPRRREPWETPLLVVLVVGVVAAVIWALLVNGLLGSGL